MRYVYDTESDGFVPEATTIHCIVLMDIASLNISHYSTEDNNIQRGIEVLQQAELLVAHNQISHDIPLMQKLHDFKTDALIFDTLILSQLLQPERQGHSLEAFGERQGIPKVQNEDWSVFTGLMLERCEQDVKINYQTYKDLLKESWEPLEGIPYREIFHE